MTTTLDTPLAVSLNGEPVTTTATTLHALLVERGFDLGAAIACAVERRFVPRAQWAERPLQAGDRIDVIAPITGG